MADCNLLPRIAKCFANMFCKIKGMQCVGKETFNEELILKKLYLAYWISGTDYDCDIECLLNKYCKNF